MKCRIASMSFVCLRPCHVSFVCAAYEKTLQFNQSAMTGATSMTDISARFTIGLYIFLSFIPLLNSKIVWSCVIFTHAVRLLDALTLLTDQQMQSSRHLLCLWFFFALLFCILSKSRLSLGFHCLVQAFFLQLLQNMLAASPAVYNFKTKSKDEKLLFAAFILLHWAPEFNLCRSQVLSKRQSETRRK